MAMGSKKVIWKLFLKKNVNVSIAWALDLINYDVSLLINIDITCALLKLSLT